MKSHRKTHGSWLKHAFTITSVCPSFFFGSPLYTLSSSVVLNSSLSSRTYLFSSFEKQSPKSNESQNVQLACTILKCVNSLISLYVNLHEMSLVPNTLYLTAFIDQRNPGGVLGYLLGGYVPPRTPNWHPVLKKFPLKLIPRSRNGPIFYTPF